MGIELEIRAIGKYYQPLDKIGVYGHDPNPDTVPTFFYRNCNENTDIVVTVIRCCSSLQSNELAAALGIAIDDASQHAFTNIYSRTVQLMNFVTEYPEYKKDIQDMLILDMHNYTFLISVE